MRFFVLFCALSFATGCATQPPIAPAYDPDHDFSGYQTYTWMGDEPLIVTGGLLAPTPALKALEQAVRDELRDKGFIEVQDRSEADFGVSIVLGRSETVVFDSTDRTVYAASERAVVDVDRVGPRRDSRALVRSGFQEYELDPLARNVAQGQLTIGVHELGSGDVVWRVSAQRDITHVVPDGSAADRAVHELLKEFPPK